MVARLPMVEPTGCLHAGVLTELYAKLLALIPDRPWRRRRFSSHAVCPDCHEKMALTLSKDTRGRQR